MSEGISNLEQKIQRFEDLLEEMRDAVKEGHELLKRSREERRQVEKMMSQEVKIMVEEQVSAVVKTELDKISPKLREQTSLIYARVQREVDRLIDIALGKEFSSVNGREDLRPELAMKLREWIREILDDESQHGV